MASALLRLGAGAECFTGRHLDAMNWSEPNRDVKIARDQAVRLMGSGRILTGSSLDLDHCFPWALWPCDDLWNLGPAHREVKQQKKRDKLPGLELLQSAQQRNEECGTASTATPTIACSLSVS